LRSLRQSTHSAALRPDLDLDAQTDASEPDASYLLDADGVVRPLL
jgi:hypothetical protein